MKLNPTGYAILTFAVLAILLSGNGYLALIAALLGAPLLLMAFFGHMRRMIAHGGYPPTVLLGCFELMIFTLVVGSLVMIAPVFGAPISPGAIDLVRQAARQILEALLGIAVLSILTQVLISSLRDRRDMASNPSK